MNREYTREQYLERISWIKAAKRPISMTTDMIVGFPGETPEHFEQTVTLLGEVQYDAVFAFKYSARPNTPSLEMPDVIPDEEKGQRLQILMDRQREIQRMNYASHVGEVLEVAVEGHNQARGQVFGKSTQNITVNFSVNGPILPSPGSYLPVRITHSFPNSLVGEATA